MANNPNAVVAKLHNQASYEEGAADEDLMPGQGAVVYEDEDGEKHVRAAEADEQTQRVVREARNPARGLGEEDESPLSQGYDEGEHVETIGFGDHDQARLRIADGDGAGVDSAVGWDDNGELTDGGEDDVDAIGRIREVVDVDGTDFGVTEFK